ncbi:putative L-cystine transporter [Kockovaella imperatae]|uniref:Putative L-cystine transporter n=1 Tax=Kockovaella imperatae TaxID=4999 RepID=A0A1Y1UGY4_9TREE|nr:putative L-cystine transporter [Kockovaella imperatae]ORX36797.1 putative L-cystine transporter [Kockovaella imperatae]
MVVDHHHPVADAIVSLTGVLYFSAWSLSFYPQVILNYRRKQTSGLSPDFAYINPLGHLALTVWSWGMYFNPVARHQYRDRHGGHAPQVSKSDLAFSLHASILSAITLVQVWYYGYKNRPRRRSKSNASSATAESEPLLGRTISKDVFLPADPVIPSKVVQLGIYLILIACFVTAIMVWAGRLQLLDWLYFVSSMKLVISLVKYIPQVILNWQLRSVEGFAIGTIITDFMGSVLSFIQLVVSSIYIEHDPTGIIANPVKLGLSIISLVFDIIFLVQNYWLFAGRRIEQANEQEESD